MRIPHQRAKGYLVASGLVFYLAFHLVREFLPSGAIKDSFPSLLFMIVALPLVDFVHSWTSRKSSLWSHGFWTIAGASLLGSILIEVVAPLFTSRAVADLSDAVAISAGGILYWFLIHSIQSRNNKANKTEQATPNGVPVL